MRLRPSLPFQQELSKLMTEWGSPWFTGIANTSSRLCQVLGEEAVEGRLAAAVNSLKGDKRGALC